MSKPLVIYHDNCADGFGAAFAAWLILGDDADYVPAHYGQEFEPSYLSDIEERVVYILDFSFPREEMDRLFGSAERVTWIDHHQTAFEMWCGGIPESGEYKERRINIEESMIILDNNKSGAMLAWEFFHPSKPVPMLIQHIDDYDRWQFKIDGTKEFNKALWSYAPWTFEQWRNEFLPADIGKRGLTFDQTARYSGLRKEGAAILRAHNQNVQSVVKDGARKCKLWVDAVADTVKLQAAGKEHGVDWVYSHDSVAFPYPGLAANCPPHLTSDVGHELATQSGTFGLCWCLSKEGMVAKCSLRSNGDYDVSAIAKAFGGGGHRNASGFEVPVATLLGWLS